MQSQIVWYTDVRFDLKWWKSKIFQTKKPESGSMIAHREYRLYLKHVSVSDN